MKGGGGGGGGGGWVGGGLGGQIDHPKKKLLPKSPALLGLTQYDIFGDLFQLLKSFLKIVNKKLSFLILKYANQ